MVFLITMVAFPFDILNMAVRVVEFLRGGTKLEIFFHNNQHTQRKLLNFEFRFNGEFFKNRASFY